MRLPQQPTFNAHVVCRDMDRDGDVDIVKGDPGVEVFYYVNDGTARFQNVTAAHLAWGVRQRILSFDVTDVDGDRDSDLVGGDFGPIHVLYNRLHHLDAPAAPVIGTTWAVDFWNIQPLVTAPQRAAIWWLAPARLPVPFEVPPFGLLQLDVNVSITRPAILLPPGASSARATLPVPNVPQLQGQAWFAQALFARDANPAGWLLSNLVAEVIL
jgi:hypothetical protein